MPDQIIGQVELRPPEDQCHVCGQVPSNVAHALEWCLVGERLKHAQACHRVLVEYKAIQVTLRRLQPPAKERLALRPRVGNRAANDAHWCVHWRLESTDV